LKSRFLKVGAVVISIFLAVPAIFASPAALASESRADRCFYSDSIEHDSISWNDAGNAHNNERSIHFGERVITEEMRCAAMARAPDDAAELYSELSTQLGELVREGGPAEQNKMQEIARLLLKHVSALKSRVSTMKREGLSRSTAVLQRVSRGTCTFTFPSAC